MDDDDFSAGVALIFILLAIISGACLLYSSQNGGTVGEDTNGAIKALQDMGFTNIKLTGYKFFACSEDDTYHTGFEAINPEGRIVTGTVCAGLFFKNSTVRFN